MVELWRHDLQGCEFPGGHSPHDRLRTRVHKSVEKGSFLTYDFVDVFCKKGIFFTANRTLGVPKWVELFAV